MTSIPTSSADDADDDPLAVADDDAIAIGSDRRAEARRIYPWLPDGADLGLDAHLDATGAPRIVERRFEVGADHAGWRLDHYLKQMIPRLSRTKLQAIIDEQMSRGSGRPFKPATSVADGDVFVIRRPARAEPPCPRWFDVLRDDPAFVVVDKPAGLPVHSSAKFYYNTLTRVLHERFGDDAPQICHRLDRETSGIMVCAKTREAAAVIKGAFAAKRVRKVYLAIVHGDPPWPDAAPDAGDPVAPPGAAAIHATGSLHGAPDSFVSGPGAATIDHPLIVAGIDDDTVLRGVRMVTRPDGAPSLTHVQVARRVGRFALVRCWPVTGRQHQIRAHLALAGYPIVGDKLYAHGDDAFRQFCDQGLTPALAALFELPRQALHAAEIRFPHPARPEQVQVVSFLPPELSEFLDRGRPQP